MENKQPIGADCVCDLGSEKHYHPQCEYLMENKDKIQDEFMEFWEKTDNVGLGNYSDAVTQWWFEKIESILKSKQKKIEGEINRVLLDNIRTGGDVLTTVLLNQHIKKIKDELKPIISNILK